MSNKLIMPKQTARTDVFFASLQIFYDAKFDGTEWVSNEDYKTRIQELVPDLSKGAKDRAYLVKQSELTRYFGLAYRDYPGKKCKITDRGVKFYDAYLSNNKTLQKELLLESIFNDSFGRDNTAIKSSDSNIDPPKLFLRALFDLTSISICGFKYLLYITNDKEISYDDALREWNYSNDCDREIPIELSNKYTDIKFAKFLTEMEIVNFDNREYSLSRYTKENFGDKIKNLYIYNKKPETIFLLNSGFIIEGDENEQEKIISSFVYDINSNSFVLANNRFPESIQSNGCLKYKKNARISKTALYNANYLCEYDNINHHTFISKTGKPYTEAHHLIPMCSQKDFSINLDRVENIVSLCPNCHSAIHLGSETTRRNILLKIFESRKDILANCGINISFDELFSKYYK